jgi:RNA polymerase sigma-70 factor, ECF subfamily
MAGAAVSELETLYSRRFAHFVRVATAIVRDEDIAVDAVQDGFATAIRERRRFRGDGPLEAWVWRIVVNAARKAHAGRRDETLPQLDTPAASEPAHTVRDAVTQLPERQRLVLFLRYYADLDYDSIAVALDIRPGTVGASLNAAHASLRRLLQEVQP